MLLYEENLHKKIGALSQLGAEKIQFPLYVVDGHTDARAFVFVNCNMLFHNIIEVKYEAQALPKKHKKGGEGGGTDVPLF